MFIRNWNTINIWKIARAIYFVSSERYLNLPYTSDGKIYARYTNCSCDQCYVNMENISNASVKWHVNQILDEVKYVKGMKICICSSCKLVLNWVLYSWVATMIGRHMVYKCSLDFILSKCGLLSCHAHYQWQRKWWKIYMSLLLWKSTSIWMKIWNDIACNLNSIQIL
jgi:hypothetical protein